MNEKIREKMAKGELIKGGHVFGGDPMMTEIMGLAGYDVLWIDMEHTLLDKAHVHNCLIAAKAAGTSAFVRIAWNDPVLAKPILDMGPDAMIFPFIRTVDEAKKIVDYCSYPPYGSRGFGPQRALEYGNMDVCEYVDTKFREMMRIVQIEHIDAVNCLEELVKIDGIDGFVVGPNDLAGSVGHIGRTKHPDMMPIYDRIGEVLRDSGKLFGVSVGYDEEVIRQWLKRGVNVLFTGFDTGFVHDGSVNTVRRLGELEKENK